MKNSREKQWSLAFLCYGFVILVWLLWCAVSLGTAALRQSRGGMLPRHLAPGDFDAATSGVSFSDDWQHRRFFTTTDSDAQLHLTFEGGESVGRFIFDARPVNKPGGDMALYYTTKPGQGFSEERKLPARQNAAGQWQFDLGGRRVYALRLDPDSVGGVYWQVYDIVLNADKPALAYFVPDALQMAVVLLAPVLLYATLSQLAAFLQPVFARRRLERRWQQGTALPGPKKPRPPKKIGKASRRHLPTALPPKEEKPLPEESPAGPTPLADSADAPLPGPIPLPAKAHAGETDPDKAANHLPAEPEAGVSTGNVRPSKPPAAEADTAPAPHGLSAKPDEPPAAATDAAQPPAET